MSLIIYLKAKIGNISKKIDAETIGMISASILFIGKTGFEPATPWSQTKCSTKLSYFPVMII